MRLTLGGLLLVVACGASNLEAGGQDASQPSPDEAGAGADSKPAFASSVLVFVDGLVNGNTVATSGAPLALDDVRVCIHDTTTSTLTPHALPDSTPMALTNYPGVHRGGGIDFGHHDSTVVLDVYSAKDLAGDAAWIDNRSAYLCSQNGMGCDSQSLPCRPHRSLTVTLAPGVNVVALVDDGTSDVKLVQRSFIDVTYAGAPSSLYGTVVDVSGWDDASVVTAVFGDVASPRASDKTLANPLDASSTPNPQEITANLTTYESVGMRFDSTAGERFGQSLDSIAFVSNAVVTPPTFYDVRENFVFVLVGNPADTTSVEQNGGRDPSFDGAGLHVVAIPYATPP